MKLVLSIILILAPSLACGQAGVVGAAKVVGASVVGGGTGSSGPTVANYCANTHFGTNPSASCTLTTTSGHTLVLWYYADTVVTVSAPTGCTAGSWTVVGTSASKQAFYTTTSNSTSCSITGSGTSGSSGELDFVAVDTTSTAGIDANPVFEANPSPSFCTSCTGPSITTVNANALAINCTQGDNSITVSSPFVAFLNMSVGGTTLTCSSANNASPGAITATWTASGAKNPPSGIISVHP